MRTHAIVLVLAWMAPVPAATAAADSATFDAAPFGLPLLEPEPNVIGVRWAEPRKVRRVVLEWPDEAAARQHWPTNVRVEYWHRTWNGGPDRIPGEINAGSVGWDATDDWYNGQWRTARTEVVVSGREWSFIFAPTADQSPSGSEERDAEQRPMVGKQPTAAPEFPDLKTPGVPYRRTVQVRVAADTPLPPGVRLRVLTDAIERPLTVRITFGEPAIAWPDPGSAERGRLEVYNGSVAAVRALTPIVQLDGESHSWQLTGRAGVLEADLRIAVDPLDRRYDRPIVTVRSSHRPFSFAADDVARGERILVDDLGVLVTRGDDAIGLDEYRARLREAGRKTVYQRVFDEPEQTLARAWHEMPLKRPLYFVHGLPGNRNTMRQHADGNVLIAANPLWFDNPGSARDSRRKLWKGHNLGLLFGFPDMKGSSLLRRPRGADATGADATAWRDAPAAPGGRALRDGWLPVLRTWWQDGPVHYEQATVLDTLTGVNAGADGAPAIPPLDEPTVLLMRVRVLNTSDREAATARLRFTAKAEDRPERLTRDGDRIVADFDGRACTRFLVCDGANDGPADSSARAAPSPVAALSQVDAPPAILASARAPFGTSPARREFVQDGDAVAWSCELPPGGARVLEFRIPSITLTSEDELAALRGIDIAARMENVCAFWRQLSERGMRITTPEPWLTDFHRAHLRHLLVNCVQELGSDRLHAHVGTMYYGDFPNESAMMISDLDRRGYHDEARRCLDMFLHYQGTVPLPGTYTDHDGVLYGAGGHEMGGYNKSHGYVLWLAAEHWRMTRDAAWMERAAPGLVQGCEWIVRQRRQTMGAAPDDVASAANVASAPRGRRSTEQGFDIGSEDTDTPGATALLRRPRGADATAPRGADAKSPVETRPLEYGFLPPGSLEDVTDFWHWLATNAATAWGFATIADALADAGHPRGAELQREAGAYLADLRRGWTEARVLTPVVRLRDGTYVPKIPSRLYERGRALGWIREVLEGPMFLPAYRLVPPDGPETTWILEDYEDNLYISRDYGYDIPAFDAFWFSRGGFSMQANLLDGPLPYLWRDEVRHFLRAFFNGFASAYYPEIRMCNEHCLPELGYPMGDHFKSSDEAQVAYWLRLMFIREGEASGPSIPGPLGPSAVLYLGQALPRYWLADGRTCAIERAPTYFGPLSLRIESHVASGEIHATLEPPTRNPPARIYLRLRHPDAKPLKSATVNGAPWPDFDAAREWVVLPGTLQRRQEIVARYR